MMQLNRHATRFSFARIVVRGLSRHQDPWLRGGSNNRVYIGSRISYGREGSTADRRPNLGSSTGREGSLQGRSCMWDDGSNVCKMPMQHVQLIFGYQAVIEVDC